MDIFRNTWNKAESIARKNHIVYVSLCHRCRPLCRCTRSAVYTIPEAALQGGATIGLARYDRMLLYSLAFFADLIA
jgi:hypothetical protein